MRVWNALVSHIVATNIIWLFILEREQISQYRSCKSLDWPLLDLAESVLLKASMNPYFHLPFTCIRTSSLAWKVGTRDGTTVVPPSLLDKPTGMGNFGIPRWGVVPFLAGFEVHG
jgi:hypothetical protein